MTPGLAAASGIAILLAYAQKLPCSTGAWKTLRGSYSHLCYTDIHALYFSEGLVKGTVPYLGHAVEYPVGIGMTMQVVAYLVQGAGGPQSRAAAFYYLTAALLAVCLAVTVFATARLAGTERRRDALLVALSPAVVFSAFTNWDLLAVALAMVGLVAWAAGRPLVAGALIGAATATKFYPLFFFGPLLLLCWRAGRLRQFTVALAGGVASWLVMNLPFIIAAPSNWARFYVFSRIRGASYGTVWLFFQQVRVPVAGTLHVGAQNLLSGGLFAACCIGIAVLAMAAPRRPRLPQLLFLVVAAFLLTGKVWSPQYVLWLAPLAVLARPKLGAYLVWQACEIAYWVAVKLAVLHVYDVAGGLPAGKPGFAAIGMPWYYAALVARAASLLLVAVLVVRDIMRPEGDVVRAAGADDPAGGVLADAPDAVRLRPGSAVPVRQPSAWRLTLVARSGALTVTCPATAAVMSWRWSCRRCGCGTVTCAPHSMSCSRDAAGGRRRGPAGQAAFVASCIPRVGGRQVTTVEDYPGRAPAGFPGYG